LGSVWLSCSCGVSVTLILSSVELALLYHSCYPLVHHSFFLFKEAGVKHHCISYA